MKRKRLQCTKKMGIVIEMVTHPNGHHSYIVLNLAPKAAQHILDQGMVVPCSMTRDEAVEECGEVRVAAFERMLTQHKTGVGRDYSLVRRGM